MNTVFRFKQFSITQEKSAMKVGTDSVVLGGFIEAHHAKRILDIGTGTGILALMMAQKSSAKVDTVEIDNGAYHEAIFNARQSPWSERITVYHIPIQQFVSEVQYDLIVSNPPFYVHGENISINNQQRSHARHTAELSFSELCEEVAKRLTDKGTCWLILPVDEANELLSFAQVCGLYLHRKIQVKPKLSKPINRVIMCIGKQEEVLQEEVFTIYDESGKFTEAYYELTRDFLLWKDRDH